MTPQTSSGIFEKNRKQQRRSVRVWFGCNAGCGMYGDFTAAGKDGAAADEIMRLMAEKHVCIDRSTAPVDAPESVSGAVR